MAASEEEEICVVPGSLGDFRGPHSGRGTGVPLHPLLKSYPALLEKLLFLPRLNVERPKFAREWYNI
jgi:hypothetical protein